MYEGDLEEGELEVGQIAGSISKIQSVKEVMDELVTDFNLTIKSIGTLHF